MAFPDELERVRLPDAFKGLIKTIAFRCFEDLGRDQFVLRPVFSTNHSSGSGARVLIVFSSLYAVNKGI